MITGISIENFKIFGKRVDIELAPITLLFGRNSAGKSTVLQALEFARQVVCDGDPSGDREEFGGFANLTNERNGRPIQIGIRTSPTTRDKLQHFTFQDPSGENEQMAELVNKPEFMFTVDRDEVQGGVFLRSWLVADDDELQFLLECQPGTRSTVFWSDFHGFNTNTGWFSIGVTDWFADTAPSLGAGELDSWSKRPMQTRGPAWQAHQCKSTSRSALPPDRLRLELDTSYGNWDVGEELDCAARGSRTLLSQYLNGIRHVGPIRMVPRRGIYSHGWPTRGDWYDGRGAWSLMQREWSHVEQQIDPQFRRLDTGYGIRLQLALTGFDLTSYLNRKWPAVVPEGQNPVPDMLWDILQEKEITHNIELYSSNGPPPRPGASQAGPAAHEVERNLPLHPRDVGVGISQLIPVVVAAATPGDPQPDGTTRPVGLVAIEQPELHVHPAVQSNLGDLFASTIRDEEGELSGRQYLIETHSEHLVLRLLRRIRETTESVGKPTGPVLRPEDVAIYYFDQVDGEAVVTRIRIDEDGEFLDKWPQGFFSERLKEL